MVAGMVQGLIATMDSGSFCPNFLSLRLIVSYSFQVYNSQPFLSAP